MKFESPILNPLWYVGETIININRSVCNLCKDQKDRSCVFEKQNYTSRYFVHVQKHRFYSKSFELDMKICNY